MDINMEIGILLAYAFGILILYVLGYLFLVPLRILLRLVINSALGGILLLLINWIGGFWDFQLPVNLISAICVGILGIPGVVLVYIMTFIL